MIVVNFKTYKQASGKQARALSQELERVAKRVDVRIILCPQLLDLSKIAESSSVSVWAQHVDGVGQGKFTGWVAPENVKVAGAEGTLLNHSEHKLAPDKLAETIRLCKKVGLKTLVFADNLAEAKKIETFLPDFIAYEPPELVGSRTTSVAQQKAHIIAQVVEEVYPIPVLAGAGIHTQEDVEVSLKQGACGIAVATDVVLADNPAKELLKLAKVFQQRK